MTTATVIVFFSSLLLLALSYVLYPLILILLRPFKKIKKEWFLESDKLPAVSILIAARNEESVISAKLETILKSNYRGDIEILAGSDHSTDRTDDILKEFATKYNKVRYFPFKNRQGKPCIINDLAQKAAGNILIITDANVMFTEYTVFHLVRHFKHPETGLVDASMRPLVMTGKGISLQEHIYISLETRLKNLEGDIWGTMMGPFGGCFAIRKELYSSVPKNFLADDFYLNMEVLNRGKRSINDLDAIVYENVSTAISEEFRRRVRISTGNFQNLFRFFYMLFPPWKPVAVSFFMHKVLRWTGPFLLILLLLSNLFLYQHSVYFKAALLVQITLLLVPLIDILLEKCQIHIIILRFITHFYSMNAALFLGFIRYMRGVKSNAWEPTKRVQHQP